MLKTRVFWLMFVIMSMMSTGGLMVITQFTSFAKSFGIDAKTTIIWRFALKPKHAGARRRLVFSHSLCPNRPSVA